MKSQSQNPKFILIISKNLMKYISGWLVRHTYHIYKKTLKQLTRKLV